MKFFYKATLHSHILKKSKQKHDIDLTLNVLIMQMEPIVQQPHNPKSANTRLGVYTAGAFAIHGISIPHTTASSME